MNKEDIRRPQVLQIQDDEIRMEISIPINHTDESGEIEDILIAPTLVISAEVDAEGRYVVPSDPVMFQEETFKRFNGYTYSLGKMVRLGELNSDRLSDVVGLYLQNHSLEEIINRNADCRALGAYNIAENFNTLTFGNLRNVLSCIVKTDTNFHEIEELNTAAKRKNFTSVYKNYIDDRDRYTHGILFFLYPGMTPVLRVKAHDGTSQYITYEKPTFIDNIKTYNYLDNVLTKIKDVIEAGQQQE